MLGLSPLIFLHIPKTGGTSLRHVVEQAYPGGRCVLAYSLVAEDLAIVRKRLQEGGVVYGHLFHGIHEIFGIEPRYVTILREPIDRAISFFRHQARTPSSEHFHEIAGGMTLLDLLNSERCSQLNNHMVRILSGFVGEQPVHETTVLGQALTNLATYEFVGVSERLAESVAVLGARLGWETIPAVPHLNRSPDADGFVFDDETYTALRRANALDISLYESVLARFDYAVLGTEAELEEAQLPN